MPDLGLESVKQMGAEARAERAQAQASPVKLEILVNGIPYVPRSNGSGVKEDPWTETEREEMPPPPPRVEPSTVKARMAQAMEEAKKKRAEEMAKEEGAPLTLKERIQAGIQKKPARPSRWTKIKDSLPILEGIVIVVLAVVILT